MGPKAGNRSIAGRHCALEQCPPVSEHPACHSPPNHALQWAGATGTRTPSPRSRGEQSDMAVRIVSAPQPRGLAAERVGTGIARTSPH